MIKSFIQGLIGGITTAYSHLSIFIILTLSGWIYIQNYLIRNYKDDLKQLRHQIVRCEDDKKGLQEQVKYTFEVMKRKEELQKFEQQTSKEVSKEIDKKEEDEFEYEILAAETNQSTQQQNNDVNSCGCFYDGTGWVFK